MTAADPDGPDRFRLLATFVAGRSMDVTEAPAGQVAHTNGQVVLVSAGGSFAEQRREVLVQCALMGAGSLDPQLMKALRGRPAVASRYLALEGHRVLAELAKQLPLAAVLCPAGQPPTASADESLAVAKGRAMVADPPDWFGVIKPSRLLAAPDGPGARAIDKDLRLEFDPIDLPESPEEDGGDEQPSGESKILKLFDNPLFKSQALADYFRKLMGSSRSPAMARPARSCRSARCGGFSRSARTRGRFPLRSTSPAAAIPAPRWVWGRPVSGVGRPSSPVPAGLVPGHRLPAGDRRRHLRRGGSPR